MVEAVNSLFEWHNESINIWSHYLTSIAILIYTYYITDKGRLIFSSGTKFDQILFFASIFFANCIPMFTSAVCHQFYFVNQSCHVFCWFLDFFGILLGMFLGGCTFLYFTFYCHHRFALICTVFLSIGFIYTYVLCWNKYSIRVKKDVLIPNDRFPEFSHYLSRYAALASISPILITLIFNQEYLYNAYYRYVILLTVLSPIMSTLGIVIFAQGSFPEKLCKHYGIHEDSFDFIGHSHQLWHLVASASMFNWIRVLTIHYVLRTTDINSVCTA